jgi:Fimbrial assembly protein (PilN)
MHTTRINLIPRRRIEARLRRARLRRWVAVCVVYALMLAVAGMASWSVIDTADEAIADDLTKLRAHLDELDRDAAAVRRDLAEANANLAASQEVAGQPDWSLLLALLAQNLGDQVVLSSCQVGPPGAVAGGAGRPAAGAADESALPDSVVVRLAGLGRSQAAVSQFVLRLEGLTLFSRVKLIDTRREPFLNADAVAFNLDCTLDPAPPRKAQR